MNTDKSIFGMKLNKIFSLQNKFIIATGITFVVLLSIYISNNALFGNFITKLNYSMQNALFTTYSTGDTKINASSAITVIEIDNRTLQDQDKGGLGRWQDFRRKYYAQVIDNLKADGAIVVGFDTLFSEKGICYSEDDDILAKAIKKAGNIILAFSKPENLYPIKIFESSALGIGDVYSNTSEINQNVYSIFPFYINSESQKIEYTLSFALLRKYYESIYKKDMSLSVNLKNYSYFNLGDLKIPYSRSDEGFSRLNKKVYSVDTLIKDVNINYLSPNPEDFQKLSFIDVYNKKYNPTLIKDKIILIGATATTLNDEKATPFGIISGVYTHANMINTVLNQKFLRYFNQKDEVIFLILFIYLITLLGVYDKRKIYFIGSLFFLIILYIFFYGFSFKYFNIIFSFPVQFFASIILSFLMVSLYRYLYEDKGKRLLESTLSQYLAADLVKSVLDNYEKVKLGGQRKENTIFFSDIAGFTTISEKMEPEELVHFLSQYLESVSNDIIDNNGFINKYEGDAVMALWGAFGQEKEQSFLACKGAIEQQKTIQRLNISFKEKLGFEISARMGINKGDVIIGNIGSLGRKIEFTALGDNVNLASRLEGINKYYDTLICVSESVQKSAGDSFVFRYLDKIKVKGKRNSVDIYELIGFKNEVPSEKLEIINNFEKAIKLYSEQKFGDAEKIFKELVELGDKPSAIFINRCREFKIHSPGETWDSSWEFNEK
ncbi:MAG: adenylate/guanylate cyclase domain-containing protein [Candidatus Gracilibacteria bacterium]|nr:adenylate/guanylate cyclase domain-containing protein [Candidatus Gracilibacteria bacterium]MDD2909015.1 adenylate/guanylate cyclase domain-containing protein [Candidatus Gracilibacteria bacterium]